MATFYTPYWETGGHTKTRVRVDYSGTWATATLLYSRDNSFYTAAGSPAAFNVGGGLSASFAGFSSTGPVTDLEVCHNTFIISTSGGTYDAYTTGNVGYYAYNPNNDDNWRMHIPAQGSKPSNGYINNPSSYWSVPDQAMVIHSTGVGCADGGLTLTSAYFRASTIPYTDSGFPDATTQATFNFTNGSAITAKDSTRIDGSLSIIGNKQYYLSFYAENSAGIYRYKTADGAPTIVTVPSQVDVWITNNNNSPTTKQIGVWFRANGGYYTQTFQYRVNGGSWVNGTTKTGASAETKYVDITGLTAHTAYTVETRITTTAGTTTGPTVSFMTPASGDMEFYGSVSSLTEHINKFYCLPGGPNHFLAPSPSGGAYTRNGDTDFTVSATKGSGTATNFYTIELALKPNTQYWFSCKKSITGTTFNYTGRVRVNLENTWTDTWDDNGKIGFTTGATGRLKLGFYLWYNAGTATGTTTIRWYDVCVRPAEAQNSFLGYVPYNGVLSKNWYNWKWISNQASGTITVGVYPWGYYLNGGPTTSEKRIFIGTVYLPAGTYTIKHEWIGGTWNGGCYMYQDQTWTRPFTNNIFVNGSEPVKTVTFTTTAAATYHIAAYATNGTTASNFYARVSLTSGSTAMDFEPYTGFIPGAQKICKIYGSVNGVAKPFFIRHVHE